MRRLAAGCAALVICVAAIGAAVADDIRVENYKNTVDALVSHWATAEISLAEKLAPILDELAQKQALSNPNDDDKARITELQHQRDDIAQQMEEESEGLRIELIVVAVDPGAPKREMVILPDWLKTLIKSKGVQLGHGITLVPDADFDLKQRKLKSFSVGLQFDWP
jgi:hypothetical protein